jgi:hypothetical protein
MFTLQEDSKMMLKPNPNWMRSTLIKWLMNNDPNGCYSDEQSRLEGFPILTQEQAYAAALNQYNEG